MRKLDIGGKSLKVQDESFTMIQEDWNEYELEKSGIRVRAKLVVQKISQILNEEGSPAFSPDGDPQIAVKHQVVLTVSAPSDPEVHQ